MLTGSEALGSALGYKVIDTSALTGDVDLIAIGGHGSAARGVRVLTVGSTPTLALATTSGPSGDAIPVAAGYEFPVQATKILHAGTSGVTSVLAWW